MSLCATWYFIEVFMWDTYTLDLLQADFSMIRLDACHPRPCHHLYHPSSGHLIHDSSLMRSSRPFSGSEHCGTLQVQ